MGLDMYAYKVNPEDIIRREGDPRISIKEGVVPEDLHYWRKHHDLHGWMEELYNKRGGLEEFNCINIELTEADLDALEESIKSRALPPTTGFFFGNYPPNKESDDEDLQFIDEAREAIADGYVVLYGSWW